MDRLITFHLIYIVILYIFIPVNKKKQFNMNANPTAFQESTRASEKGRGRPGGAVAESRPRQNHHSSCTAPSTGCAAAFMLMVDLVHACTSQLAIQSSHTKCVEAHNP
jgi:hypothetical protein